MIRVRVTNGFGEPVVLCDVCHSLIVDASMAAAIYPHSRDEADVLQVLHVHKGECMDKGEVKLGVTHCAWVELTDHLRYLVRNAGAPARTLSVLDHAEGVE